MNLNSLCKSGLELKDRKTVFLLLPANAPPQIEPRFLRITDIGLK